MSGLEALFSAVQYQIEQEGKGALPHGTGLLNITLQVCEHYCNTQTLALNICRTTYSLMTTQHMKPFKN